VLPNLLKEASGCFPASLAALRDWQPPWAPARPAPGPEAAPQAGPARVERGPGEAAVFALLAAAPEAVEALAGLLGVEAGWAALAGLVGR
jgi:hypothetical protein